MFRKSFLYHLLAGLLTSFALSMLFWLVFDVFVLSGFIIWSVVWGLAGSLAGHWRNSLWTTVFTAAILRVLHFFIMYYLIG